MSEQTKTINFALIVCVVCSLALASVHTLLKDKIALNEAVFKKTKILGAFGQSVVDADGKSLSADKITAMYDKHISGVVLDKSGKAIDGKSITALTDKEINVRDKATGLKDVYPVYVYTADSGEKRYAIHLSGMGLWDIVKAYMAFEPDLNTISSVAFYENSETPGLGAEVEKPFFQDKFKGKTMLDGDVVKEFTIVKAGAPTKDNHTIDGITGATMTCKGVNDFINSDFAVYNKYLATLRK